MKKWIYSGTREEQPSERELMHGKLAKKAASEGIVLLKNEGILPLKKDTAAALLGLSLIHKSEPTRQPSTAR